MVASNIGVLLFHQNSKEMRHYNSTTCELGEVGSVKAVSNKVEYLDAAKVGGLGKGRRVTMIAAKVEAVERQFDAICARANRSTNQREARRAKR